MSVLDSLLEMDLKIFKINWLYFSIGAGFNISQCEYQKRYDDPQLYNCLSIIIYISGLQMCLTIPLWKTRKAELGEPK